MSEEEEEEALCSMQLGPWSVDWSDFNVLLIF